MLQCDSDPLPESLAYTCQTEDPPTPLPNPKETLVFLVPLVPFLLFVLRPWDWGGVGVDPRYCQSWSTKTKNNLAKTALCMQVQSKLGRQEKGTKYMHNQTPCCKGSKVLHGRSKPIRCLQRSVSQTVSCPNASTSKHLK
eukprot:2557398-Amphidinium_carterae.1